MMARFLCLFIENDLFLDDGIAQLGKSDPTSIALSRADPATADNALRQRAIRPSFLPRVAVRRASFTCLA